MCVEGEFLDAVIGIPDFRTEIVMLRPPDGGTLLELSTFVRPDHQPPGRLPRWLTSWGCATWPSRLTTSRRRSTGWPRDGYGLVGDIGQYEHLWRMAYVRGPEGIIVSLAERVG